MRVNWRRYYPTVSLVDGEAAVRGDLTNHAMLLQIQENWSLPTPTNITSRPDSCEHSPPQTSWVHAPPVISVRPAFSAPATTVPEPHAPYAPPLPLRLIVDINAIIKAVVQATLAANSASITANQTTPYLAPTLTQPVGGHPTHPQPSDNLFLMAWNWDLHSIPIFQA